jgi:hypothetical protein
MKLRALKGHDYLTRRLKAGDEFETTSVGDADILKAMGLAEPTGVVAPPVRRRRLSEPAPKVESEPEPEPASKKAKRRKLVKSKPEPKSEPVEEEKTVPLTRPQLLDIAEEHEVDLPSGYVPKADLVTHLEEAGVDLEEEASEVFGEDHKD